MFRVLYYTTLSAFLFGALVFWVYTDQFFRLFLGSGADAHTISMKEYFVWGVVWISAACLVLSILAISKEMNEKILAYLSLIMSAITIVIFIISFFGHGVMPTHGIL